MSNGFTSGTSFLLAPLTSLVTVIPNISKQEKKCIPLLSLLNLLIISKPSVIHTIVAPPGA